MGNRLRSYGASPAIWDHTVLSATGHHVSHHALQYSDVTVWQTKPSSSKMSAITTAKKSIVADLA